MQIKSTSLTSPFVDWSVVEHTALLVFQESVVAGLFSGMRNTWPNIDFRIVRTLCDNGSVSQRIYRSSFETNPCTGHRMSSIQRGIWESYIAS